MIKSPIFEITPQEAAIRQLKEAIKLFFEERDSISIHTLAASALQILQDLHPEESHIKNGEKLANKITRIGEEGVRTIRDAMRTPQNAFKHADKQKDSIEFNPQLTQLYLFDATFICLNCGHTDVAFKFYIAWFFAHDPKLKCEAPIEFKELIELVANLDMPEMAIICK